MGEAWERGYTYGSRNHYCSPVSATVCEAPIFSSGASGASGVAVEPFGSTIVNSEIVYQCQTGLLPEERRTLLCEEDGRWSPDPQSLCTGLSLLILPYKSVLIKPYSCSRQKSVYSCYCSHCRYCLPIGGIHYWDCVWCFAHCLHQQVEQEGT